MKRIIYLLFFLVFSKLFCAFENLPAAGAILSRANIEGHYKSSYFEKSRNFFHLSILYPYQIDEFLKQEVCFLTPIYQGRKIFIRLDNFGNQDYRENTATVYFDLINNPKLLISPALNLYYLSSFYKNYFSYALSFSGSFIYQDLVFNLNADNLIAKRLGVDELENMISFNFKYKIDSNFSFYGGVEKSASFEPIYKLSLEYDFREKMKFFLGNSFNPNSLNGGVQIAFWEGLVFDYGMQYDYLLGLSHALSFGYEF